LKIKNVTHVELLSIHKFTIFDIESIIKDIIQNIEFTPDNYSKLLEENDNLKRELEQLKNNTPENYNNMMADNARIIREHTILREKTEDECKTKLLVFNKLVKEKNILYNTLMKRTLDGEQPEPFANQFISTRTKRIDKQPDGLYYLDEGVFPILMGTRQEVWEGTAYKTAGGLTKSQLIIGTEGNVVSKTKSITSSADNRLMTYMLKVGKVVS